MVLWGKIITGTEFNLRVGEGFSEESAFKLKTEGQSGRGNSSQKEQHVQRF